MVKQHLVSYINPTRLPTTSKATIVLDTVLNGQWSLFLETFVVFKADAGLEWRDLKSGKTFKPEVQELIESAWASYYQPKETLDAA